MHEKTKGLSAERYAKYFRVFGTVTVGAVLLLILVGGIVRTTGSGMGCPDWPKCFGQWVPPTDVSELPPDYKTQFAVQGREIADFNAVHTWIEYLNRLLGALIGLFVLATFGLSLSYWKSDRIVTVLSGFAFVAVGFQGWLGSKVVSSDLHPATITAHMLVALAIVAALVYTVARSYKTVLHFAPMEGRRTLNAWLAACIALTLAQIALGTQVREAVDHISTHQDGLPRSEWVEAIGARLDYHRYLAVLTLVTHAVMAFLVVLKAPKGALPAVWAKALLAVLVLETATGLGLHYFGLPKFLQPTHLLLASLGFCAQFVLLLTLNPSWFGKRPEARTPKPAPAEASY